MSNREKLLGGLNLATATGIEIGPLCRPIIDKAESQVLYVDHTDTESLRRKFAGDPNVDVDKIVYIDGVWGERSLKDCLGGRGDFDYVIASHVIEHVPDLVGWLNEIGQVLRPGGRLCLVIPDRRYTFDYKRRSSGLADVIELSCVRSADQHQVRFSTLCRKPPWSTRSKPGMGALTPADSSR